MASISESSSISTSDVRRRVVLALKDSGLIDDLTSSSPEMTGNSRAVLERRYLAKDREGNVLEDPDQMFHRVAHNLAQADRLYGADDARLEMVEEEYYQVMSRLDYLPNSPTLMNAGRELQMLSACFVLPVLVSKIASIESKTGYPGTKERGRHRLCIQPAPS